MWDQVVPLSTLDSILSRCASLTKVRQYHNLKRAIFSFLGYSFPPPPQLKAPRGLNKIAPLLLEKQAEVRRTNVVSPLGIL